MKFDAQTLVLIALLLPSITFHEFMHGYAAYRLGDPTAKNAGRLSLNPLRHIDRFGTILLPLLLWASGGPIFGYAKPVPVNPRYFKDIRKGDLITGVAGPAANLALALFGAALSWGALPLASVAGVPVAQALYLVGSQLVLVNLVLMFFNLIPIPPLDGSSIIPIFLSDKALHSWYQMQRYSFGILLVLLWVVPMVTNVSPVSEYFKYTVYPVMNLLLPG
ncbi:MAG: site-2 protease family protein [Actinobacteria bacterium HGW-Actinobacteria-7]|nr:MAG: site-2 protease family protein [Actinobacteria bacterium HGW-Actinobacteria-7]